MKASLRRVFFHVSIGLAMGLLVLPAAQAAAAFADPSNPGDRHIHVGQYDLSTNLWGIRGAGDGWYSYIFTNSDADISGSGYEWSGFAGDRDSVKAYSSVRFGASNQQNDAAVSGLPYRFEDNRKNVDVLWEFTTTDKNGNGRIIGRYNHTLDIFFNAGNSMQQSAIRGEIMILVDSSQDSQTAGWGVKDRQPFSLAGQTWDVWQVTQHSNGHDWHVTQFRKRENSDHFSGNLREFFAEAAVRHPEVFMPDYYVMMVEAGTEIKYGSGQVYNAKYSVRVY